MTYFGGNGVEMGALLPEGGSVGAGIALSSGQATYPALAGDLPIEYGPHGTAGGLSDASDGVAVWLQYDGTNTRVESATHDSGPRVVLPFPPPWSGAPPHTPVTFGTGVFDPFSPITSINWTFGDGATGTGETVTHSYSRAGVFLLGVTATDAAGLISSPQSETLNILAPIVPTAPKLKLSSGSAELDPTTGRGTLSVICTAPPGDRCSVHGSLYGPGKLPAHAIADTARKSGKGNKEATKNPKLAAPVGAVTGTIPVGKRGTIRIKLTAAELKQLKTKHTLTVRLIATITDRTGRTSALRATVKAEPKGHAETQAQAPQIAAPPRCSKPLASTPFGPVVSPTKHEREHLLQTVDYELGLVIPITRSTENAQRLSFTAHKRTQRIWTLFAAAHDRRGRPAHARARRPRAVVRAGGGEAGNSDLRARITIQQRAPQTAILA